MLKHHSTSDYNFYKSGGGVGRDANSRGTPNNGRHSTHHRFANNSSNFNIYKQQNPQQPRSRESNTSTGQRSKFCGEMRKQSSTQDRPSKLADVLPRTNSQALSSLNQPPCVMKTGKVTISQQFSMTDHLAQSCQKAQDIIELNESKDQSYSGNCMAPSSSSAGGMLINSSQNAPQKFSIQDNS